MHFRPIFIAAYLVAWLALLVSFAAEIIKMGADQVACTQSDVGATNVTTMMVRWAKDAQKTGVDFPTYLQAKVLKDAFPSDLGPDIWTGVGERSYILDAHHRGSGIKRILFDEFRTLPSEVKQVMSEALQRQMRSDPNMKLSLAVETKYSSIEEMVMNFVRAGRGQLPAELRADPKLQEAIRKLAQGDRTHLAEVIRAYRRMAPNLGSLRDFPLRSALGDAFFKLGIDAGHMKNYVQFDVADRIQADLAARGVIVTAENAASPEIIREVSRSMMQDSELKKFLHSTAKPGREEVVRQMLSDAEKKYAQEFPEATTREPAVPSRQPALDKNCPRAFQAIT